ncbi:MAG: MerR family transcriptional regulator [Melioribacteraceae bacterium]|nr:MerR family transcriptional regulator [Melioribacteraceae bacterium]MCF8266132.1 MerR family transcriptional regulator [Melioribacteraceae bacterium]MCF8413362.1 MerR family transcriptional regulator [Melioribacteraceae bacterium]MCF8432779.1 MerR family transcriptional regulator [Melioribacteraceae bacterium]
MKDFGLKKLYYSISEVSKLTGLEQYILRYWETEFDQLKPAKNRAGNRIYTNKDIKLIIKIKELLREEKYTIEGAKKILLEGGSIPTKVVSEPKIREEAAISKTKEHVTKEPSLKEDLEEIKGFLLSLQQQLK